MGKLTEEQHKLIIADRLQGQTLRAIGKKYGVSASSVMKICREDTDYKRQATEKSEAVTQSILEHMENQRPRVQLIIDDLLDEISNKDKQATATLVQLATTMGILIDKFTASSRMNMGPTGLGDDPITAAIKESFKNAK